MRSLPLLLALTALSPVALAPTARAQTAWDSDSTPYPGVRVRRGHLINPVRNFRAAFVDLCTDYVHVIATAPPGARQTTGSWGSAQGVQLAVNGDFFQYVTPPSVYGDAVGGGIHWPLGQTGVDDAGSWYYRDYGWIAVGPDWVDFSHTRYIKNNAAAFEGAGFTVQQGWSPQDVVQTIPPGTQALVSGFPALVIEGRVYTCPDPQGSCFPDRGDMANSHLRTAMGITQNRRTLIFVVTSSSVTGAQLAQIMGGVGAWQAFNIDGGGSSTMWLASSGYLFPSGTVRAVANHWGVYAGSGNGQAQTPGSCFTFGGCYPVPVANTGASPWADFRTGWVGYTEALALDAASISDDCQDTPGPMFCPRCGFRRREAARWLAAAAGLDTTNPPASPTFADVPASDPDYAEIEAIALAGITNGCGNGNFCPERILTRAQAAAFIRRAAGWPAVRPATPTYGDVPTTHTFYGAIEAISAMCVTSGCGNGNFCPDAELTRAQAAAFIARAFDIDNLNSCFDICTPVAEVCDGADNDCDGQIDEGGVCPTPDAGVADAAPPSDGQTSSDAAPRPDGVVITPDASPTDPSQYARARGGCNCRAGGDSGTGMPSAILLAALVFLAWRRRRQRP